MKTLHFGLLGKENTSPFIVTAILYSLLLCLPFIYFLYLKGQPHSSNFESVDEKGKTIVIKTGQTMRSPDSLNCLQELPFSALLYLLELWEQQ